MSHEADLLALQPALCFFNICDARRAVLHQKPWAWPKSASHEAGSFSWSELGELLGADPQPDVLVVARSQR